MKIGLGIYQRAKFAVPENPITRAIATGTASVGVGCVGLGCGSAPCKACSGMGDLNDLTNSLTSLNLGSALSGNDFVSFLPNWAVIGGGWLLLSMFSRGSDYSRAKDNLRKKHPRGYKRVAAKAAALAAA